MSVQQFNTPSPVRLEIKLAAADVRIKAEDGKQSSVNLEGPERLLESVHTELVGDRLLIEQRRKAWAGWFGPSHGELRVEVSVPTSSRVKVQSASADVALDGVFAGLQTKTASGDLTVTGRLEGDALIETVSGDARLSRVAGDLTVHTVSGDATADAVEGSVSAKSVSGDVRVGSVRAGQVSVQSVSGDVALGIATGSNIDVDAGSTSGTVSSEIPLAESRGGEGGPTVVVRGNTVSGDFRVFRAV